MPRTRAETFWKYGRRMEHSRSHLRVFQALETRTWHTTIAKSKQGVIWGSRSRVQPTVSSRARSPRESICGQADRRTREFRSAIRRIVESEATTHCRFERG